MRHSVIRPLLAATGLAAVLALAGCGAGGPEGEFLAGARMTAPAKHDSDGDRVTAGFVVCNEHQAGKTDSQIADWLVTSATLGFGDPQPVTRAEADRFVPYALKHCEYLLSADAQRTIGESTLEYLNGPGRANLVEQGMSYGQSREEAEAYVDQKVAELEGKLGR